MRPVAIVTGSAGGLGRAIVAELEGRGYEVARWSRSLGIDVADEDSVERAFAALERVDVLINNAAVLIPGVVAQMTAGDWDEQLRSGLRSAFLCSRGAFGRMAAAASIVNVSSLSGVAGAEKFPGMGAYVAAKSGLAGLTEVLAVEGRSLGIRVNAISPGSIDTPMSTLAGVTGPKLAPAEVARLIGWLASPESAPLSGANLRMDPS